VRVVIALAIKVRANHDPAERETIKLVADNFKKNKKKFYRRKSVKAAFMLILLLGIPNICQTVGYICLNCFSIEKDNV
jgi:hypothetical protein